MNSDSPNKLSLKYRRFTPSGCENLANFEDFYIFRSYLPSLSDFEALLFHSRDMESKYVQVTRGIITNIYQSNIKEKVKMKFFFLHFQSVKTGVTYRAKIFSNLQKKHIEHFLVFSD